MRRKIVKYGHFGILNLKAKFGFLGFKMAEVIITLELAMILFLLPRDF